MRFSKVNSIIYKITYKLKRIVYLILHPYLWSRKIQINGIPNIEYKVKVKDNKTIFLDILDEMITKERSSMKDIEERFIATVACKAAVKAGMDLSRQEVENLISSLLGLKNPYTCPHGRPTTIKIDIH